MSSSEILLLGAIAGFTIFLGLPIGRIRTPVPRLRALLNAVAIGILVFLLWDVLAGAIEPIESAVKSAANDGGSWLRVIGLGALMTAGVSVGLLSLVYYDRWLRRTTIARVDGAPATAGIAGGALGRLTEPKRLAFFIALGIGFHNLSEGLAIGQAGAAGDISLAVLLIIGFGLHNATEGFGIVAPLSAEGERPTWAFLAALGLIGGGPTFVGTLIGQSVVNEWLYLAFLSLAAGSILYVVMELLAVATKLGYKDILCWGLVAGLVFGFATDMVLVAAGV
jgi:ZIP family zinc transporter